MQTKMSKISTKVTMVLIMALFLSVSAWGQISRSSAARNLIWEKKLYRKIEFLTDTICHGRATGTIGNIQTATWISREFKNARVMPIGDTYVKRFQASEGVFGGNVIGFIPGSIKTPKDKYVIVGAHYDHLGDLKGATYPGADSNASGTVALLSLAEMFSVMKTLGKSYNSNIIFVAFDARELSMAGSNAMWQMIVNGELQDPVSGKTITPKDIKLMVNIDQIGSTLAPLHKGMDDYIIMLGKHSLKPAERELLSYCNRSTGLHMDIDYTYYGSKNFTDVFYRLSDQRVFIDNNIPAVLFTSGITMNTNRTRDTAETLDYTVFKKRIYLIFEWLEKML